MNAMLLSLFPRIHGGLVLIGLKVKVSPQRHLTMTMMMTTQMIVKVREMHDRKHVLIVKHTDTHTLDMYIDGYSALPQLGARLEKILKLSFKLKREWRERTQR